MSNASSSADDTGLIGSRRWQVVSSGSTVDLVPVGSTFTPLKVSMVAVLVGGGIKLTGAATIWAFAGTGAVVVLGLIGLGVNRAEEKKFRRIRFNGLRRLVEIGEDIRPFDSLSSIGIDRVIVNGPNSEVHRAILALRVGSADAMQTLPLIRGHLFNEPRMEVASRQIAALTGVPIVHQRKVAANLRNVMLLVLLMSVPLATAIVSEVVLLKEHLDRRHLKERAVFTEASVLSDEPRNGPNRRGPFRTVKLQFDGRTANVTTRRWDSFEQGEKVTVFYDPTHPNQVEMDDSRHSLPAQAFLLTGPLAAIAFIIFLMAKVIRLYRIAKRT